MPIGAADLIKLNDAQSKASSQHLDKNVSRKESFPRYRGIIKILNPKKYINIIVLH